VCLSVTFVDYVKTNNRIVKIFLPHHSSFSMTLNDLWPRFQEHAIIWRWISQKRYKMDSYNEIL